MNAHSRFVFFFLLLDLPPFPPAMHVSCVGLSLKSSPTDLVQSRNHRKSTRTCALALFAIIETGGLMRMRMRIDDRLLQELAVGQASTVLDKMVHTVWSGPW